MNARSAVPAAAGQLPSHTIWLLLAGLLGAVLLNAHHTALWCVPVALGASIWRARTPHTPKLLPNRVLRAAIVVLLTVAVLLSFRTLNGLDAGASLLVAMAALKLTETIRERDWLIVIGASLFLLLAACLDAQALWRLPLYAAELWLLCTALYALGAGAHAQSTGRLMSRSGRSLAAAVPLALVLFLFFPRLPGSFWALPEDDQAMTGLGDEMSPGSISRLTESDEPALRVRFDGALPPAAERYWRGPVLHNFDGYTWRRQRRDFGARAHVQYLGEGYSYEITLEPNEHNDLIALELALGVPESLPAVFSTFDHQLILPQPIARAISYRMQSFPQHRESGALSDNERRLDLQLPHDRNPRSLELARTLRGSSRDDPAYVDALLSYLRQGGFSYTLTPALLDRDSVDDLLFHTHEGFCGHYASAFAMLLRAGGVPARVVTGYLGGQWNRFGGYLLVRQSDAHAWTEAWLDGQGWVRVDPTAVVAPGRLTRELDDLLPAARGATGRLRSAAWIGTTLQAWQAMNAWWQDEFIGFNFSKQINFLGGLGFKDHELRVLASLLGAGGALWLGLIAWGLRPRPRAPPDDALRRSWRSLERKLRRISAPRAAHEGPMAYAERVGRAQPEWAQVLNALARRYARLRYGASSSAVDCEQFRRAVQLLRLPRVHPRLRGRS